MTLDPLDVLVEEALHALAQLLFGCLRRVGLENAGLGLDDLAERPEGHSVAIGKRAALPPGDQLRVGSDMVEQLEDEPALADAWDADDRHQLWGSLLARASQCSDQDVQLARAADQRRSRDLRGINAVARPCL